MEPIRLAIIGLGNWGRNHVRTFAGLNDCRVKWLYDDNPQTLASMARAWPSLPVAPSAEAIWNDAEVQAVVVATSAVSHYALARAALLAGKDVLVEKPMTLEAGQAEELCRLAEAGARVLQVGHLLLYHPAVQCLKMMIERGELGDVHYIYAQRLNLGVVRNDENSLWSLAPHDVSLCNYLMNATPESLKASGGCYLRDAIEDVIFLNMIYPGGRMGHVHVSWLDPCKVRRLTIVGSRKMAVFDDMQAGERVRVYDKGVSRPDYENFGELLAVRTGDILIPNIPNAEPLKAQAQAFLEATRTRRTPLSDGRHGLEVVRALEAATRQLHAG